MKQGQGGFSSRRNEESSKSFGKTYCFMVLGLPFFKTDETIKFKALICKLSQRILRLS